MKKFYAFAIAAMAVMSMNAQIYICGDGEGLGWNPENPMEIQPDVDGIYSFELKGLKQFKVSTAKGNWDTFNKSCRWIVMDESALGIEQPVYTSDGGANMATPWEGDYTFEMRLDEQAGENNIIGSCTVTTTTPKPGFVIQEVYIRGDMNGWGATDLWKFQTVDGVNYKFICQGDTKIYANQRFKIANSDWSGVVNLGLGNFVTVDAEQLWYNNGGDSIIASDFEGTITFMLGAPRANVNVLFSTDLSGVEDIIADGAAEVEYFNLQGVRVANPENGVYIARQGNKVSKVLVK